MENNRKINAIFKNKLTIKLQLFGYPPQCVIINFNHLFMNALQNVIEITSMS